MKTLDKRSQEELISEGQALVHSLASKASRSVPMHVDFDDLVAYGQLGLAEAAREFDPAHGAQFTTFAYYRIRGAIYDGMSKMSWTSRSRYNRLRYEQMANATLQQDAENPSGASGSAEEEGKWLRNVTDRLGVVFLSTQSNDEASIRDSAIADPGETPASMVASREIRQKLAEMIDQLPADERQLIRTIYFDGTNLQEAATLLGISKSWASRLHAKTLDRLGRSLRRLGAE
jgi:RNA polymerase sigma factor for flagellar operon FliA